MAQKNYEIQAPENIGKERLDKFLVNRLPEISRARLQKLIDDNNILVNEAPTKASHIVKPGELIRVAIPGPAPIDVAPENLPLEITYEDDYLLVLNKAAGMVVHPAFANFSGTLVNALLFHCRNLSKVGGNFRPGLVHRLDKDTSGLLVVAKDDHTHALLAQQFSARTIDREYVAVVWGICQQKSGRIETHLGRSRVDRTRIVVQKEGKKAITDYQVLEEFDFASFVRLKLHTGRTHQIRVHMMFIGHPVFGDGAYSGRNQQLKALNRGQFGFAAALLNLYRRQMLHARTLGFDHPHTGAKMRFECPLPDDLQSLLAHLRRGSV